MKEEAKVTENLKRELEMAAKKMKTIEQACQKSKNDLEEYQVRQMLCGMFLLEVIANKILLVAFKTKETE